MNKRIRNNIKYYINNRVCDKNNLSFRDKENILAYLFDDSIYHIQLYSIIKYYIPKFKQNIFLDLLAASIEYNEVYQIKRINENSENYKLLIVMLFETIKPLDYLKYETISKNDKIG